MWTHAKGRGAAYPCAAPHVSAFTLQTELKKIQEKNKTDEINHESNGNRFKNTRLLRENQSRVSEYLKMLFDKSELRMKKTIPSESSAPELLASSEEINLRIHWRQRRVKRLIILSFSHNPSVAFNM